MKSQIFYLIVLVIVMGIFSACTAAIGQPTIAAPTQPPPVTETPRPSETLAPSNTSPPLPTASFTTTPSVTHTVTETSTPTPAFAGFSVSYAQYTNYGMLIGLKIPGIKENYRLMAVHSLKNLDKSRII